MTLSQPLLQWDRVWSLKNPPCFKEQLANPATPLFWQRWSPKPNHTTKPSRPKQKKETEKVETATTEESLTAWSQRGGRNDRSPFFGGGGCRHHPWQPGSQSHWNPWQNWAPWKVPLCPYPTANWNRPNNVIKAQHNGVLILGPQQAAFNVNTPNPGDIENVIHTLNLAQQDPLWYMDTKPLLTGWIWHPRQAQMITLSQFMIFVVHTYHPHPSLVLKKNVLHVPNLI